MIRRKPVPKPEAPANGIYFKDPDFGGEVFVSFDELHTACSEIMVAPSYETGKDNWRDDPTYNLRRKK